MNFPKIGMRNIKTSTSVFLCLLIFNLVGREDAIHACIAAVICMQNTIDDSFTKGTERVIGTIIGGIAGGFVLYIVTTFGHEDILIFIIPLGIVILIELCVSLKLKQAVVICCVVYLGILISKGHKEGYVLYTFNRVVDTTLGILIALIVNKYMNIPDKLKKIVKYKVQEQKADANLSNAESPKEDVNGEKEEIHLFKIENSEKNEDEK